MNIHTSRADNLPAEIVESVAEALYECEKRRAELATDVFSGLAGKAVNGLAMEPWEECRETFVGDAKAALNTYFATAYPAESQER